MALYLKMVKWPLSLLVSPIIRGLCFKDEKAVIELTGESNNWRSSCFVGLPLF